MDPLNARIQRYITAVRPWFAHQIVDVMVCRSWTITDSFRAHAGKGYILSDNAGYAIQGEARCSIPNCPVCTLEEGRVYKLRNFKLLPNTAGCCFNRYATICLQLDPITSVTPVTCSFDGFVRYPFHPIAVEDITFNESKYLIDVIGVVIWIGVSRRTTDGTFIVDCSIISARGFSMRMTLLNAVATTISHEQQPNMVGNIYLFTGMDVRELSGELYLTSTPATTVHNCEQFPAERAKFVMTIENAIQESTPKDLPPASPVDHSLTQLLYVGRANNVSGIEDSVTMKCKVVIVGIKMLKTWLRPTCPLDDCQNRVVARRNGYWCDSCQELSIYAPPGYNLHLDVTYGVSIVTVKFGNGVAEKLLNKMATTLIAELGDALDGSVPSEILLGVCGTERTLDLSSHSYHKSQSHECFTCSSICHHQI